MDFLNVFLFVYYTSLMYSMSKEVIEQNYLNVHVFFSTLLLFFLQVQMSDD